MEHKEAVDILNGEIPNNDFTRLKAILLDAEMDPGTEPLPLIDGDINKPGDLTPTGIRILGCLIVSWICNDHDADALVEFIAEQEINWRARRIMDMLAHAIRGEV